MRVHSAESSSAIVGDFSAAQGKLPIGLIYPMWPYHCRPNPADSSMGLIRITMWSHQLFKDRAENSKQKDSISNLEESSARIYLRSRRKIPVKFILRRFRCVPLIYNLHFGVKSVRPQMAQECKPLQKLLAPHVNACEWDLHKSSQVLLILVY